MVYLRCDSCPSTSLIPISLVGLHGVDLKYLTLDLISEVTESYLQIPRNVKLAIVYENRADLLSIRPGDIFWLLVVGNGAQATVGGRTCRLLWDTTGEEDYDRLRPYSYPDAHEILICLP